ncbi:stromal cell-derived factor 2-like [Babylonia areolata]|uniref:stromal cell-derived factor 2-like n=1 Tax=Babylonia areolata TaxID=304850 RepID=UPI003FD65C48
MASGRNGILGALLSFAVLPLIFQHGSASDFDYEYVTCGSTLKMLNPYSNTRLHSHDVKYGSGSAQQSVTATGNSGDHNSYWQVRGKTGTVCPRGSPVKCGQTIRLMHLATRRNLHSHQFQSPLSRNLEVSAFGENGHGDEGDNWVVVCKDMYWSREEKFRLKHVVTEYYLHISGETFGRPIRGQKEVCGFPALSDRNYWRAAEGIYIKPPQTRAEEKFEEGSEQARDEL